MGLSQLPIGLTIAILSWFAAYGLGYLAVEADGSAVGLFAVTAMIAMIAITIAWVVSWMVVEATMLDWRLGARQAAGYECRPRPRALRASCDRRRRAPPRRVHLARARPTAVDTRIDGRHHRRRDRRRLTDSLPGVLGQRTGLIERR